MNFLKITLEEKSPAQRWHHITKRLLVDTQHRCITRTAAEEWNLAAFYHPQDVTNAEFMRTFMSQDFPGGQLIQRLDDETKRLEAHTVRKVVRAPNAAKLQAGSELLLRHFPDHYGYRGGLPDAFEVYYLSPWQFLIHWEVKKLPAPPIEQQHVKTAPPLTIWVDKPKPEENFIGTYILNPVAVEHFKDNKDILFYPRLSGAHQLRDHWYMVRRMKPMVPAPCNTPMPDGKADKEKKGKLFSVYFRPWVLEHDWATVDFRLAVA